MPAGHGAGFNLADPGRARQSPWAGPCVREAAAAVLWSSVELRLWSLGDAALAATWMTGRGDKRPFSYCPSAYLSLCRVAAL